MGMRPDGMERWGVVGIFKEAARLLHRHSRLFMPFLLAFYLPASISTVSENVFLSPNVPYSPHTSFVKAGAAYATPQKDVNTDSLTSLIFAQLALSVLISIFSFLSFAAFAYIVAYVYSDGGTEGGDDSIARKVFKQLPHAFLRIFVTQLWEILVLFLLVIACMLFAAILDAILTAIIGGPSGPSLASYLLFMVPYVIGTVALGLLFALAQPVAVLEPEKFGRAALKQSSKYAKGRAGTIFCILLFSATIGLLIIFAPLRAVANAELPLGEEITVAILVSILSSVYSAYIGVVLIVTYFVCKSSFEAVLPEFQRGSNIPAAENPYKPIVFGSTQP